MPTSTMVTLIMAILVLATLYSSVGHAGASGYLAAMAIVTQLPQDEMKAIALTLNIFVGAIGSWRFYRAGHFHWATFWPFALCAIPLAFVGGLWQLPTDLFKPLVGFVLLFAAGMLILKVVTSRSVTRHGKPVSRDTGTRMPPLPVALGSGAVLGLLAGLTGTGGGIFLSPLLILFSWADAKRTAAVSVVFVLVNSLAGLGGVIVESPALPPELPFYIVAAVIGGLVGSWLGAKQLRGDGIRVLLAVVLLIAAVKMVLPAFQSTASPSTPTAQALET
ncbi:MAG: sulfite exporter TauE/SafE family protein [Planctomycetota bacterium]|nr:sulfite exporter TauE/SafE family protein [Planctomycetota bacterium]